MSRFIQEDHKKPAPKKEPKPKEMTKPGKYTSDNLQGSKSIYSGSGGKY